ncbi:class A beta-lactamase [Luteimonas sp. RD2P54]|uniref:Beta-lactamase n=1 Tax=Luteimonas endophytica TaxID=3042023 RepID=A0ABT6JCN8_9GAMM|nr:class A beta-lactamase [Luteimonas endophytica]MDH5824596.1 class A beta-lactamase [Luteimonas endophytica]
MIDRRGFLRATGGAIALAGLHGALAAQGPPWLPGLAQALDGLERDSGGRLGVAILDSGSGRRFGRRADERFPMCSTFKLLLAAAVLRRVDQGSERLDRNVSIAASDLVPHSPRTGRRVGEGMRVDDLCRASMIWSDNAAANLLLRTIGGPGGLTRFARALGDPHTRLDRWETALNSATPGDPRDTTTPAAMAGNLRRLLLGEALHPASRALLTGWLVDNRTGDARLRAGLPAGWRAGDKTGTSINAEDQGTANDIAVLWPPGRQPVLVACYLTGAPPDVDAMNAVHAAVARAAAAALG